MMMDNDGGQARRRAFRGVVKSSVWFMHSAETFRFEGRRQKATGNTAEMQCDVFK